MLDLSFSNARPYDLIALGRVTVDLNPVDYGMPLSESTTFKKYVGGSPANIAIGLSRLGKKTGFFSRVSNDQMGDYVVDFFKNEGVDTSHVLRCTGGESIGLTFTEILSDTQSSILMFRNEVADSKLCVDDIDEDYIRQTKILLISGTSLATSPSREAALKAMYLAKKNGVKLVFDIDYRPYQWKSKEETSIYYATVAHQSDIILGSREEYSLTEQLLSLDGTDEQSSAYWMKAGNAIVVIKHGKDGSVAYTDEGESYHVKPFPVKLLKSFGGGDGYASAFLYGLLDGLSVAESLELGSASAAMLVASHACAIAMPDVQSLKDFTQKCVSEYGSMVTKNGGEAI